MNNDIKLNDDIDLDFTGGDFNVADSEIEHLEEIIRAVKGDYVQTPELGVDLFQYLDAPGTQAESDLKRSLVENMELDGFSTSDLSVSIDLSTDKLTVNTSGKRS